MNRAGEARPGGGNSFEENVVSAIGQRPGADDRVNRNRKLALAQFR